MSRLLVLAILVLVVWAPWLSGDVAIETVGTAFGPFPATCFDADETTTFTGVAVRWYPLGRMVHTCSGDYVAWLWGGATELGGVYKSRYDIDSIVRGKPLSCDAVIARLNGRLGVASTTPSSVEVGPQQIGGEEVAVDTALFPEAKEHLSAYRSAIKDGSRALEHFAVAEWSCGAECTRYGVINTQNGRVIAHDIDARYGLSFATSSDIIMTNPKEALPPLPEDDDDAERLALILANLPREYFRITYDALSDTDYLVRVCIESSTVGYVEVADGMIWGTPAD